MSRILPHNLDAEASVLGGIMLRREALDLAPVSMLDVPAFYGPKHQAVWTAIQSLRVRMEPIDPVTIDAELLRTDRSSAVGGLAFVSDLAGRVPTLDNVEHYAWIVLRLAIRRNTIEAASDVIDRLYAADDDDEDLNGEAAKTFAISTIERVACVSVSSTKTIGAMVVERMRQLYRIQSERESGGSELTGIPTGVASLDRILGGYQRGIVTAIGGRPGMGKSSVMLAAIDAASAAGIGVHAFLLEDSEESQADRAIARESEVSAEKIRAFNLQRDEFERLGHAVTRLRARGNWHIEDKAPADVHALVRAVRRDKRKLKTQLVVVDYAQIVAGSRSRKYTAATRHLELDEVMTAMMQAAKDDGIAYLVGSQLNRSLESRTNKRPTLADLRESGAIEERSKAVVFPYRGSHYGPAVAGVDEMRRADGSEYLPLDDEWAELIEFIVEKNSNGPKGRVFGTWHGPTMRVS